MDRENKKEVKGYFRRIMWISILLVVIWFNYDFLSDYTSSNNALIRDFQLQEDVVEKYKEPAVAGVFYAENPDELNRDLGKYLKSMSENQKY